MQNYKKNFVKQTLAWVLAAVMVIAMVPVGVFAETYTTIEEVDDGSGQMVNKEVTKTTDWSETFRKDLEKTSDYWGLSQTNVLIPTPNDPVKTFNIRYVGRYTRPDGREVVRLLTTFRVDTVNVWKNLLVKFPENFAGMIDTTDEMTGLTTGPGAYGDHDRTDMENIKQSFNKFKQGGSPLAWDLAGGKNVYAFNMHQSSEDCYFPLDLVLKDGASVDNLKEDILIQARLTDKKYKRIYKRVDAKLDTYMQYTNATVIPIKKNEDMTVAKDLYGMYDVGTMGDNKIHSTVSTVNYNLEKGYIDIFYRLRQAALGNMNKWFGLRLSMDSSFYGLIQEQKGIAGVIFTLDPKGKFYSGRGDNDTFEPNMNTSAPFTKSQISTQNGLNILQVINGAFPRTQDNTGNQYVVTKNDTSVAILNGALATSNQGVITVIRLYVDRERLYSTIKEKGIRSYNFETQVIRPDEEGTSLYEWKADSDIDLKRGDKVTLKFDSNTATRTAVQIIVGTKDKNIDFINTINYTDKKNAEWTVPFDIKLKKGEMFVVRAVNNSNNTGTVKVFFNTKKIVDISKKEVSHKPLYYRNSAASTGGILVGTSLRANVDEIFTDSPKITGHSYFEGAEVNIVANETSTDDETDVTQQMIAAKGSDKDPDDFSKAEDDELQKYYNENVYTDAKYVDGKLFKAFEYDTTKPNNGGRAQKDENGKNFVREYENFQMPNLSNEKDGQILVTNRDVKTSIFHSDSVKEQVQAKFYFDLNGQTSVLGNLGIIEKIAPLNKEFKYTITEVSDPNNSSKILYKAEKNNNYNASGFETDNLRVETETVTDSETNEKKEQVKKVKVYVEEGEKGKEGYKRIEREVPSFLDHDNRPYDLTAKDADIDGYIKSNYNYLTSDEKINLKKKLTEDIIKSENERLFKRSMPETDEINVPSGKKLIGWTTIKLTDDPNGKTAVDKFNELKAANKVIKTVEDWAKADANENYIFDANSPIDKERTVYAVYGEGINIILHSNNTDDIKDETTITVPITISDIDKTDKIIDAISSPTFNAMKGNLAIKDLPKVPVTGEKDELDKITDKKAKLFNLPKSSFIGWTTKRYANNNNTSKFAAGNNNERIGEITKGLVENGTKKIPQKTEWLQDLNKVQNTFYIPNGYSVAVRPQDIDRTFTEIKKAIEEGKDIHLYANYRPFFKVNVIASYKNIDRSQGKYGKYVDTVESTKKKAAKIGLLRRTAVTPYGTPTVHQNANYYPFEGGLKAWTGNEETLTWEVPGFDELGQRMSYVSVVVPSGKEQAYKDFAVPNWSELGMKTYLRINNTNGTITHEPTAPRNLHENAGNPYGDHLAKDQAFDLGLDAYTSATSRNAETADRNGTDEVVGYTIWNTSTPIDIPKPVFDKVYDTDKEVKLKWEAVEKKADIKKIKLTIADDHEVILERQADGSYKTADGKLTATPSGDKLVIKTVDLTGKGGKNIIAKYVVEKAGQEKEGPQGDIQINTKGNSAPVERMKQTKNDKNGNPVVEFDIPNPIVNKPVKDTVYTVQKWDKDNNKWVDVPGAKYTMTAQDTLGDTKEIPLSKDEVSDGDIIRIVSKQPDSNESASTQTMDTLGNITGNFDDGIDNNSVKDRDYVELDMVGPEIIKDKAKDEAFRRFIDISAAIKEIPEGRKVTVEVEYPDGEKVNETFEISVDNPDEDKAYAIEYLNNVLRKGAETNQVPTIKLTAVDEYGNKSEKEVNYTATNVLEVRIKGERAGKKFIKVTADKANAEVTVKVVNSQGDEVATGTVTVATAGEFVKLTFSQDYRLQSGDTLVISGTATEAGKTYTSNPFKRAIK